MIRAAIILSASLAALGAQAADLRTMMQQPGEWEATIHGNLMPTTTQKGCYGGDKSVADLTTKSFKQCSQKSVKIGAGSATVDAVCELQGIEVTVHGIVTPVGNDALHSESEVQMEGLSGIGGLPAMTVTVDAHRTGPCRPGEKPM